MDSLQLAIVYNRFTGSNVTHRDVEQWGIIETAKIHHAMDFLSRKK